MTRKLQGNATEPFWEQAENTNRVNVFGTMNLCDQLFPLLRDHARVVHVSSSAGKKFACIRLT